MISIEKLTTKVLKGKNLDRREAGLLWKADLGELMYGANRIRRHFKGNAVNLCSIINAKSGACSENCSFCAQSGRHRTGVVRYPLVTEEKIFEAFAQARASGARCFGIVTSGRTVTKNEVEIMGGAILRLKNKGMRIAASLGELDLASLKYLKKCGLKRFHHNLETAESFFPRICTSHVYADRLATLARAKEAGLEICCGGIFGLGETAKQRTEFAFTLKKIGVDSLPMNFLNPIPGTPLASRERMSPREALRTIAVFRFVLPETDIGVCGGREMTLRDLQSWIFQAGANGMMVGGYLTTGGRDVAADRAMLADLGLAVRNERL